MYAFKVFVSTLIVMVIVLLAWASLKGPKSGIAIASILMIVNALSLVAIWG